MNKFVDGVRTLAVVCTQWGDTGKGKFVDLLASWARVVARGTGGANAGHTICLGDKTYILHLVPAGILHPGTMNVIGSGVVLDPRALLEELRLLRRVGVPATNLSIAYNAKLVLPSHIFIDRQNESGAHKIGTTGRGIGPAYQDHYGRVGLIVNDLFNPTTFKDKLALQLEARGLQANFVVEEVAREYLACGKELAPLVHDTDSLMKGWVGHANILLEGSQGNMLSIDYGSYPYVTASDCSMFGLAKGVGLSPADVDKTLSVAKAFYMTRVGRGPFPTEMGGQRSAVWCSRPGMTRQTEEEACSKFSMASCANEFELGIVIRREGNEYGATTGRLRRTGWFDIPLLRHSLGILGKHQQQLALTKLDVLDSCSTIKICTAYQYVGPTYQICQQTIQSGDVYHIAYPNSEFLEHCVPQYQEFPGWMTPTGNLTSWDELPVNLQKLISFVGDNVAKETVVVSVGPSREQTIFA